jgi:hypothetical protein
MKKAYLLKQKLNRVKGASDYDIWQVNNKQDNQEERLFWQSQYLKKLPPFKFEGKLQRLEQTDYPLSHPNYPILSARMILLLRRLGYFNHQIIALNIYARSEQQEYKMLKSRFAFLHLPEILDVIDREKSTYYESGQLRTAVLKEPPDGYPPIFRINTLINLCVSAEAKQELERRGITGVRFIELKSS